jgi:hypothetical protein
MSISPWRTRAGDELGTHQVFALGQRWHVPAAAVILAESLTSLSGSFTVGLTSVPDRGTPGRLSCDTVFTFRDESKRDALARALGALSTSEDWR